MQRLASPCLSLLLPVLLAACAGPGGREPAGRPSRLVPDPVPPTRRFTIVDDRPHLDGKPVELWGIRCGNALCDETVTERHIRALDNMVAHGINLVGVYIQGSNGGWPDFDAGRNGFDRRGNLKKSTARRLERLVRAANARDMVVMVGLCSPRKDQDFVDERAIRHALEEAGRFLVRRRLRNVFVDIMHEYDHSRVDKEIFLEPGGAAKKARLTRWFKAVAPEIPAGVCPYIKSETADTYPGMEVRIIQKGMPIPATGFVVNVETHKQDSYENDGVFTPGAVQHVLADCARFRAEPRAAMLLHAGFIQGIGNYSGTAPHPEMGGYGTGVGDRGVRFYYEWVRDQVGRWEYPRHRQVEKKAAVGGSMPAPTREFSLVDGIPHLGGRPVKLWGIRCHNALISPAVAERLTYNLDNFAAHGINLVGLSLQGTNAGFPRKEIGPNAFAPDGRLIGSHARRLERLVRAADARGMAVCLTLMMPRKDGLLRDEAAVRRGIEETGRFLKERGLRNVFVNLFQEFHHPLRIDHDIFQEPEGAAKKARLTRWLKEANPELEAGICPNHRTGSPSTYPGCDIAFFHEAMPIPEGRFAVNTETPDRDLPGREGIFNRFHIASLHREWRTYLDKPRAAMLFRTPYVESIRGRLGHGPNYAMGGTGLSTSDPGITPYFKWLKENVGPWRYPHHRKP